MQQRGEFNLFKQVVRVVGAAAVCAQCHVHAVPLHVRKAGDSAAELEVGDGAVRDACAGLREDVHVFIREPDAVGGEHLRFKHACVIQRARGRDAPAGEAFLMFLLRFGNVHLQHKAVFARNVRHITPHGRVTRVFCMDSCVGADAAVSRTVKIADERARFLNGAVLFRVIGRFIEGKHGV